MFLGRVFISNSWSGTIPTHGVHIKNAKTVYINNFTSIQNGQHGILVDEGCDTVNISSSTVTGNSKANFGGYSGIVIISGSNNISITGSRSGPTFNGTGTLQQNSQQYGCIITGTGTTAYTIKNNNFAGNISTNLLDLGGGTSGTSKFVGDNIL